MASGSFGLNRTAGSSYCSFFVNWSSTTNVGGNYSDVIVSVYVSKSSASTSATYGSSDTSVSVTDSGTQYENGLSFSVSPGGTTLLFAKSYRVGHNSDGSKSIYIGVNVGGNIVGANGGATVSLDTIPRYLNSINIYNDGSTKDSISVRWTCDPARSYTQYSLNGGDWIDAGDTVASDSKSGTFVVRGLNPDTEYSIKIRLKRADSGLWSESGTIKIKTLTNKLISIKNSNEWVKALPYVKINGEWQETKPYIKVSEEWKEGV